MLNKYYFQTETSDSENEQQDNLQESNQNKSTSSIEIKKVSSNISADYASTS